jgi:hypothetical protein
MGVGSSDPGMKYPVATFEFWPTSENGTDSESKSEEGRPCSEGQRTEMAHKSRRVPTTNYTPNDQMPLNPSAELVSHSVDAMVFP